MQLRLLLLKAISPDAIGRLFCSSAPLTLLYYARTSPIPRSLRRYADERRSGNSGSISRTEYQVRV
jgi:hypothetical protein